MGLDYDRLPSRAVALGREGDNETEPKSHNLSTIFLSNDQPSNNHEVCFLVSPVLGDVDLLVHFIRPSPCSWTPSSSSFEFQLHGGGGEGRRRSSRRAGRRRRKHHHKPFQGADQGAAQPSFVDVAGRGGTNAPRLGAIQDRCDPFRVPRESLQSKIMASTGVPAVEAKALLQAQCETVTAKSSSSSSAPPGQSRASARTTISSTPSLPRWS